MAVIFLKIKSKNISMRFKRKLNECPQVAFKQRYRTRMGGAVAMASIFNADIWKKNNISLSSFYGQGTNYRPSGKCTIFATLFNS